MKYEYLITQLCEVIKESEINSVKIYDNLENISKVIEEVNVPMHEKNKIIALISDSFSLIQHQDLHKQKIERVVNTVCEKNNIDPTQFNLASSAKHLKGDDTADIVSDEELEMLIKQMANN